MKKSILKLSISSILIASVTLAFAAPKPPSLLEPHKFDNFAIKQPISFSWAKVSGASKYRLIVASDAKFSKYQPSKNQCAANSAISCFSYTTQTLKYVLSAKNALLQTKGTLYWQVQAIGASGSSTIVQGNNLNNKNTGDIRPFVLSESLAIPRIEGKGISVDPAIATAGSSITFNVTLTTELLNGYSVKIDFGDGEFKKMDGAGVEYSYHSAFDTVGEDQGFTVTILDANGEVVDSLGDSFTILAAGADVPIDVVNEPVKPISVPSVSAINVLPSSVVQGNSLTFSANLSASLPAGYSVKVNYGNGLFAMSGSGTSYSYNATPTSSAAYSIGIYDAKNVLKSNQQTGNFSVNEPNTAPTLSLIDGGISATLGIPYIAEFSASDSNLSLIFIDWGDGATESKNATSGAPLSFSHTYNSANSFIWNATAYDSQDATSSPVSKTVNVTKVPVAVTPTDTKTTTYTKIANNGSELSDDAKLGSNPTDWACTKDNKTGLLWEVKTDDAGLRDKDKTYTWLQVSDFTTSVNTQTLCGLNDWRMPTRDELKGIVKSGASKPSIDTDYFPNTKGVWFWSASVYADYASSAWIVNFYNGSINYDSKFHDDAVRLVYGEKSL